ncbi:MAG: ATP-binding protein [Treponema sp.]|nr:ATP-binding protein [Treponema sp.]
MPKKEHLGTLLNTMNEVANLLLTMESGENMVASVLKGMALIGQSVEVDRVQIWQDEMIDGSPHFIHKYQWISEQERKNEVVQIGTQLSYSRILRWTKKFLTGEYINSPVSELPEDEQDFLVPYQVKSIAIIPLFLHSRLWGLFSIQDCREKKAFSEEEISILRTGGLLIANVFLRNNMMQNIRIGSTHLEAALKEAREANKAKSKFLATMSHEIRSPMNVVLGVAESQLLEGTHTDVARAAFEKIFDSGNLLLRIINDILDLSKIEAGKFELNPTNYEMLSLINDVAVMNVMQYGHKQIDFKLKVDENVPLNLFGDELRIKQILNNLISNAFKYTNVGEIVLSFSSKDINEKNTVLLVSVKDTGQGMTQEQLSVLFEEYTRFNLDANRTTMGTGLGMTITNNLLKMMDGKVSVESTPGVGSTFTLSIPQVNTTPGEVIGKEVAENLQNFNFSGAQREKNTKVVREPMPYGKVFVVDDMKSNLDVAKLLLNPYKLNIDTADSGFEALDIIKSGKVYDIIFMDHMMPGMDGIETVKKIRESGYEHPIFALTADAIAGQRDMFLANGFTGFISKPIDLRQLNDALNKFVRDKERRRTGADAIDAPDSEEAASGETGNAIHIPGVNTKIGLALYGGDIDIYIAVLRAYVPNAINVIDKMRFVSKETLSDYAINVHGLKGISAGIGADKIKVAAQALENKSRSNDLEGVLEGNESILRDAENTVSNIQEWLEELDNLNPKPLLPSPDRKLLADLQKSCESYDMNKIDDIMDELESANYQNDASLITWMRERINEMDLEGIASKLKEYEEGAK